MFHLLGSSQKFAYAFVSGAVPFRYCSWEERVLIYQGPSSNLPEFTAVSANHQSSCRCHLCFIG